MLTLLDRLRKRNNDYFEDINNFIDASSQMKEHISL